MTNRFVGQRELSEVMPNHFRFDFDLVEGFSVMDTDDATDHVGKDNHVSEMSLHDSWFLVGESLEEEEKNKIRTGKRRRFGTSLNKFR